MERGGPAAMIAYRKHWLPGEPNSTEALAAAVFLERRYWRNHEIVVANGIARAFRG